MLVQGSGAGMLLRLLGMSYCSGTAQAPEPTPGSERSVISDRTCFWAHLPPLPFWKRPLPPSDDEAPWLFRILRVWPLKSCPRKLGCQLESHDINKREPSKKKKKKDGNDVEERFCLIISVIFKLSSNLLH